MSYRTKDSKTPDNDVHVRKRSKKGRLGRLLANDKFSLQIDGTGGEKDDKPKGAGQSSVKIKPPAMKSISEKRPKISSVKNVPPAEMLFTERRASDIEPLNFEPLKEEDDGRRVSMPPESSNNLQKAAGDESANSVALRSAANYGDSERRAKSSKLVRCNKVSSIDQKENSAPAAAISQSLPDPANKHPSGSKVEAQPVPTSNTAPDAAPPSRTVPAAEETPPKCRAKWHYFRTKWVIDTKDEFYYYWLGTVSCAFAYNLIVVIARTVFYDLATGYYWIVWVVVDFVMDAIYVFDMFVRSRTGFLEQGLLVRDIPRIRKLYLKSVQFKLDILSVFPCDLILSIVFLKPVPYLRFNRIIRYPRFSDFVDLTETRSSMPNAFRVFCVVANIVVIIHWNACIYFFISELIGLGSDGWVYGKLNKQSLPDGVDDTLARRYIYSFYWSTLILTTIGEVPSPQQNIEFAFVILDLMCGVLIFATIVGNVGSMISNMSAARTEFQSKMDGIKQYMELRKVSKQLEMRVIKWFDYLWANKQSLSDQRVLKVLPDKLQTEIAMQVHFETLRKVRIFQDCEAGLLAELVLKLQQQVFSPGDYICRKGDIGREMYIVKQGRLQVVADDGQKVFATLQEGAVFGELSILNIAGSKNGNRRTANVRSVGYTDLFVLNKNDLWTALKEYPDARKLLIAKGREILRKDDLLDENAPEEQMTVEEMTENLQNSLKTVQIRLARFVAEFTNTKSKLLKRIEYLETQLAKYQAEEEPTS